jgi:hypothetical protein
VNPEDTWRLYSAMATAAGVTRRLRVDDGRVMVGSLRTSEDELAVVVNSSGDSLDVPLIAEQGAAYSRLDEPQDYRPVLSLQLAPFEVTVLRRSGGQHIEPRA